MSRSPLAPLLSVLLVIGLAGCAHRGATPGPEPSLPAAARADDTSAYAAQSARESRLADQPSWRLRGRVAFANGGDGATVGIDWTQRGDAFEIRLVAPVTGRSWVLRGSPDGAELGGLEDGPRRAQDAEALLLEATGWRLPVRHFPHWVRGARGLGPASGLAVDGDARPIGWMQDGWRLHYPDWWDGDPPLPRRVFAQREGASVRLVVAEWTAVDP